MRMQSEGFRQQASGDRQQASGDRQQASGDRCQMTGFRYKAFGIFISLFLLCFNLTGQEYCKSNEAFQIWMEEGYDDVFEENEQRIKQWVADGITQRSDFIIPVVVHIVWNRPEENITNAQILSQIDVLNQIFNSQPSVVLPNGYDDVIGNPSIQFCLAQIDPQGNITNGITRTFTSNNRIGIAVGGDNRRQIHYDDLDGKDAWDPDRYLNIWVGNMDGVLGFANLPGIGPIEEDGLIIDPRNFGLGGIVEAPF
ncbi:MAG: hypothetical protein AAGK97_13040, partial [Bacteroidota bacterium]